MAKIYVKIKSGTSQIGRGYILDISNSGICIASNKKLREKDVIEIAPEKKILPTLKGNIKSVVISRRKLYKYRLGIKLVFPEKAKKERLRHFIKKAEHRNIIRLRLL
ncbi:MAG: PilZ domain-containing protein [Candidatus Omnitrophica bacterium]|nr:PilZ domain-containing protein [Candidatus Omnitrophota bacterium]